MEMEEEVSENENSPTGLGLQTDNINEKKGRITAFLLFSAVVCFLGSPLQFGYNLSVVNAPQLIIKKHFNGVKNFEFYWSLAVSIFAIGGMFGAFIGPHIAKRIGRRSFFMANNVLVISGGVLLFFTKSTKSVALLCIARVLVGINAGGNSVVAPMYLSEIAPVHLRGAIGTLSQFGIVSGLLLGNILGLEIVLGTEASWHILFGLTGLIGVFQLLFLPLCPESPRWLILVKSKDADALAALKKLRGEDDVLEEVNQIKADAAKENLLEQLSGIGGILFYSTELFHKVGLSVKMSQYATCGVGGLSVLMTLVTLLLVEVAGRRALMLIGLGGMAFLYSIVTVAFYHDYAQWAKILGVVATLTGVAFFQSGPGAIPWFIVAELFSQSSISAAVSLAGPVNWLANFLVGLVFPFVDGALYPYTFIPFMVLLLIFFGFTFFVVPETKGRSIAEINAVLHGRDVKKEDETTPLVKN